MMTYQVKTLSLSLVMKELKFCSKEETLARVLLMLTVQGRKEFLTSIVATVILRIIVLAQGRTHGITLRLLR